MCTRVIKRQLYLAVIVVLTLQSKMYAQRTEEKLHALGIQLQEQSKPLANYVKAVRSGNLVFLAGQGPLDAEGKYITGKLGKDLTVDQGKQAARLCVIALLGTLKTELGSLDKVKRIVKVTGWVNSTDEFYDQPQVMNGCSDLLVEIFGERGRHARAALGANTLPFNIAVEVEMIVEVAD
jgi:enamine deaminase RidA (YjgF/YER057c/UK114 family)